MKAIIYLPLPQSQRIKFHIPYKAMAWRIAIKKIETTFYHPDNKLWSIVNTESNLNLIKGVFGDAYVVKQIGKKPSLPTKNLSIQSEETLYAFHKKLILKGYSEHTVRTYRGAFINYLIMFENRDLSSITKDEIESYIYKLIVKYRISETKQNQIINAIKFYYEKVLRMPREYYDIQRPKRSTTLPNVLSTDEVKRLLNTPLNLKHKVILTLMYSAGLRISEVSNIRIQDIHSGEGYIFLKGAKGKKDRRTVLSNKLITLLREYYKVYKPSYWLIEGQSGGQYSGHSINKLFRNAVKKANINPWATPHTLRHSFATHMIQNGTNLRYVQALLGHSSSKTTEIYTHVMNVNNKLVKSPLDYL